MYFSTEAMPRQLMPTIEQQVARAVVQHKLQGVWLLTTEDPERYRARKYLDARDLDFPVRRLERAEFAAAHVAVKLAKIAFSRYADGLDAEADRPIPNADIIGSYVNHDQFTELVRRYMRRIVKRGNQVYVSHEDGRVFLRVYVKDGEIMRKKGGLPRLVVQD